MNDIDDSELANTPVFPLPHVVLFPESRLPLHIFEPRYRAMLAACLARPARAIIIAQLDRGGSGRIREVASAGVIVEHQTLPDGRSNIVVAGTRRVRIDELLLEEPPGLLYKRARFTPLVSLDVGVRESDRSALVGAATMFATEVKKHDPSFNFSLPALADAGTIADSCAFQLVVDASTRQLILEELDPRERVRLVIEQLALQHGAMLGESTGAARGGWGSAPS